MSLNRWLCTLLVGLLPMVTVRAAITEQDVVALPVKGLNAVKQDGSVVFMSENGRFVIKGELYDLWYKKRITDFVEMRTLATHLDLAKMKLDVSALNSVSMGKGRQKSVVVFVSHRCPHCRALIQQAQPLTADYRFQWILIAHAEPSDPAAIQDIKSLSKLMI